MYFMGSYLYYFYKGLNKMDIEEAIIFLTDFYNEEFIGNEYEIDKEEIQEGLKLLDFIKSQQSKIKELEADKLEMAKAIAKNWIVDGTHEDYCINCKNRGLDKRITHSKDCIVKKSNKYIKEVEK